MACGRPCASMSGSGMGISRYRTGGVIFSGRSNSV